MILKMIILELRLLLLRHTHYIMPALPRVFIGRFERLCNNDELIAPKGSVKSWYGSQDKETQGGC